jgi:RNA polymerase sigma-70 factor (ECF subfamily)
MLPMASSASADASFEIRLADLLPAGYRLAYGMLHDPATAEDVVQEAAVKAWRKRSRLRSGADPLPWFLGIVANECRSARRHRWWSVLSLDRLEPAIAGDEDGIVRGADLRRALLRLSVQDRLIIVLFFYLDLPLDDVARVADLSVPAARSRLYRSVKKLRPGMGVKEVTQ